MSNMPPIHRSFLLRYGSAVASLALATGVALLLDPAVGHHIFLTPFFIAILFTAWFAGLGPSLVTFAFGLVAVVLFLVPPLGPFAVQGLESQVRIGFYVVVGLGSAILIESLQAARRRAEASTLEAVRKQGALEQEICERKEVQEALQQQREWWRVTLGSVADAVIATDRQAQVVFMNAVAQRLTGWTQNEAIGRAVETVFHVVDERTSIPLSSRVHEVLQHGRTVGLAGNTVLIAKDQVEKHIDEIAAPILDDKGTMLGVVLVFRDITERKRMENETKRQAEALQQADRRKDEFLALLGHELRNPLAPIQNAVQIMLQCGVENPQLRWARGVVERQVQLMARLVDDLLDVSRITRGKIQLREERVDLGALVARAIETSRPLMQERHHELTLSLPSEPVRLQADPARLEQILVNLLNNAAKYTERDGHVWLTIQQQGAEVEIRVKDNGIGIRLDMMAHIFEPFVQGEKALNRSQGGLGIGLTLVKRLVEMQGGSVVAKSAGPNRGCEFIVRLPTAPDTAEAEIENDADQSLEPSPSRRILVVDDNKDSAESLAVLLRAKGHEVFVASDGVTALEAASDFRPDVVISDIGMPGMDGYELGRRLKALPGMEHVVLVALTGWSQETDRRRSLEAGFAQHLGKPVAFEALNKLLAHR
jgi:PAS domain S-box-containing protein